MAKTKVQHPWWCHIYRNLRQIQAARKYFSFKCKHQCHVCAKICLSESELLRLVKSKHPENLPPNEKFSILKYSLDIFLLKSFIDKNATKLAEDAYYPENIYGYWNGSMFCAPTTGLAGNVKVYPHLMKPIGKWFLDCVVKRLRCINSGFINCINCSRWCVHKVWYIINE